jgi:hypothetical protein
VNEDVTAGAGTPITIDLRQLKTKNEKLKSQNGSCVPRTNLLMPSAKKDQDYWDLRINQD